MSDDLERLSDILDDLAAERDPAGRSALSADEATLAETAAFLKAADAARSVPDEDFVARLGARLAAQASTPDAAGDTPKRDVSRRNLLGRLATATAGLVAGAGAGAAAVAAATNEDKRRAYLQGLRDANSEAYHAPMVPADRGRWQDTGYKASALAAGSAVRFQAGALVGFLVNPGAGKDIYAVSAACTHMGCIISWLDDDGAFLCPCHGAQYNRDGTVLSGIVRRPLPRLKTWISPHSHVFVWTVDEYPAVTSAASYQEP